LIGFGQNWGEIWEKVIRFGQNQNRASPKLFGYVWQKRIIFRSIVSERKIFRIVCTNIDLHLIADQL